MAGGISDKIQVLEETAYGDGGAAGEVVFGSSNTFSWNVETSTIQSYGLEQSGPQATHNVDGVLNITGTHEWELTDGRELKAIFGDLPVNSGGAYTLDVANALPSYSVKAVDESADNVANQYIIIKGLKYQQVTINVTREETIKVTGEWTAQTIESESSFTPTVTSIEPLTYLDSALTLGGTSMSGIDSISIVINRNNVPRRFIEDTTTGNRRLISQIIEGPLNVSFEGSIITKRSLLEEIWGSTSIQDVRTDVGSIVLATERGDENLTLTLSNSRITTLGRDLEKSAEVALANFNGVSLDIDGTGSYAT